MYIKKILKCLGLNSNIQKTLERFEMISKLIKENRSLLGNEKTFEILKEYIPLKLYTIPSGLQCFDWKVPKKWLIHRAVLKDMSGNTIIDAKKNILQIVNYSNSFKGILSYSELLKHLYVDVDIPYRTAYYSDSWGFCLREDQFKQLKDEQYQVDIDTEFVDSAMILGECFIKGRTNKEIILTSYICHPKQIHDGLSGVQLLVNLYNKLIKRNNKYTYRIFFIPETIGSIALLSQNIISPESVEFCMVVTCVAHGDKLNYKKTYLGNHTIDNIIQANFDVNVHEFKPWGSDERQFSSPNVRIPTCLLMRTRWQDFDNYHTGADNAYSKTTIDKTTDIYFEILKKYETEKRYLITHQACEPFLTKYDLYRKVGVPGHSDVSKIINWIIFLSDGKNTISDMVIKSGFSMNKIQEYVEILIKRGLIK